MTGTVEELLAEGRAAVDRGDGASARRAYEAALSLRESGEALEGLGRAWHLELDYARSIRANERAFAAYRQEGDGLSAARTARMVGWLRFNITGDWAVATGWLGRGRSLLEQAAEGTAEHGWAELLRSMAETDHTAREGGFRLALAIGRRAGEVDLEVDALGWIGLELVLTDRIEEGLIVLDEALAAICAGEVLDVYVIEGGFCAMLLACERAHDVVRAEQWVRAGDELAKRRHLVAIGAFCRVYLGGILTVAGRWPEAETALVEATRFFDKGFLGARSNALLRLADLRVRQGRLEEAAVLLDGFDQDPGAVRTLAALWFARDESARAHDLLERALQDPELEAAVAGPLLSLLVDVLLAQGAIPEATTAAARLSDLARDQPRDYLQAAAALAQGRVSMATGAGDARAWILEALRAFARAQMPIELARTRLEFARLSTSDRPDVALAEAQAALDAFERLDAARDADAAAELVRSLGGRGRPGPKGQAALTRREAEVLELLGHGLSNPEIADRLFISRKTAEHHVGQVLGKLELRNRAEAAAYAARAGSAIAGDG